MITFKNLGRVGRLGNALFQFAATEGIAATRGDIARFNADWLHRPYFSVSDVHFLWPPHLDEGIEAQTLVPHLDPRAAVYLQDYELFRPIWPLIADMLAPSEQAHAILDQQTGFHQLPRPILAVHVRRGDNVVDPGVPDKHNYFPLPTLRYYLNAIEQYEGIASSVAVFSDDIDWCEKALPGLDYYHRGVSRPKEHEPDYLTAPVLDWIDLQLMALCEHHVLSNSSFGVWGALLAEDPDAIIVDPFYGPALDYIDATAQYPKTWRRMNHEGVQC